MPPNWSTNMPPAPSGHTSAVVQQYYAWLYANGFASIPAQRIFDLWSGPFYIFFFILILAGLLFIYAWWTMYTHRSYGELYGVQSFGGYLLERIGKIEIFTYVFSIIIVLWALYFLITQAIWGSVY